MAESLINETQKANLEAWIQRDLHSKSAEPALANIRRRFIQEYGQQKLGIQNPTQVLSKEQQEALNNAITQFDKEIPSRLIAGAQTGAKPSALNKKLEAQEQKAKEGFGLAIDKAADWFLGAMGWVWQLLKYIPVVGGLIEAAGEWFSEKVSGKEKPERDREKRAAGAALTLQENAIMAGGHYFVIKPEEMAVFHHQFQQAAKATDDFAKAPPDAPATTSSAKKPNGEKAGAVPPGVQKTMHILGAATSPFGQFPMGAILNVPDDSLVAPIPPQSGATKTAAAKPAATPHK